MFVRGKICAMVAGLMISLAACESGRVANKMSLSAEHPFRRGGADWHPFSPQLVIFRDVENDATAGSETKTYVDFVNATTFSKVFGNVVLNGDDPPVAGLASRLPYMTTNGYLVRLNSPEIAVTVVREKLDSHVVGEASYNFTIAEIWLFPRADQLDSYITALGGMAPGFAVASKRLGDGCVETRVTKSTSRAELAVLAMHTPDKAISWSDPSDRACLVAFFAESFGVRPAAVNGLMPAASGQDCTLARILRPGQRTSNYQYLRFQTDCPAAPVKRAASLVWYAQQRGAGWDPQRSAGLVAAVKENCALMREQNIVKDESCSAVLQGVQ